MRHGHLYCINQEQGIALAIKQTLLINEQYKKGKKKTHEDLSLKKKERKKKKRTETNYLYLNM